MIKNGGKIIKTISNSLQFIDSSRFMASLLSNLVNNFDEAIHKIRCQFEHDDEKCRLAELNTKIVTAFLNAQILKIT